jgi:hypothetical protein
MWVCYVKAVALALSIQQVLAWEGVMKDTKSTKFFFHYNKPASRTLGSHKLSVHWKGVCHIVDSIDCKVPTRSKINKRQPFVVIEGRASSVVINRDISRPLAWMEAVITNAA